MASTIYDKDGRLRIPNPDEWPVAKAFVREAVTVSAAFCPEGHDLVDPDRAIGGSPGIRIGFRRPDGEVGEVVLNPTLGCFDKIVLSSELVNGEELSLFCPVCHAPLPILMECHCQEGAVVNMLYLTRDNDPYHAIAFCNVVGCRNSSMIRTGDVIRAANLGEW
ncbi:MAG: hypothetical protein MUE60_16035 [Candidatus Eisenbacteria bacterium]|jgi:hypothetical protein|nr:hypothetical protein [Candidatus Eisenbacteria bacterium]